MTPAPSVTEPAKSSHARSSSLILFGILCLGLGLRVCHIGMLSLWRDEAFTYFFSVAPLSYLWTTGFWMESNPPLYYTVMHFWIPLFGPGETALRSFSVLISSGTILVVYALGKELGGRSLGLIGALLMAVLPTEIWYAQEARTYALLQLAISVTLLGAARYLSLGSMGSLLIYAIGALAAVYSHDTAFVFIVALNLAVISSILWNADAQSRLILWVGANVVVALAMLPLFLAMLGLSKSSNILWLQPITFFEFLRMVAEVMEGPAANREFLQGRTFSYLLLILTAALLVYLRKLDRRTVTILVLTPVFFVVLGGLLNFYRPMLVARGLVWTLVPLSLLIAHVLIHAVRMRPVIVTLIAAILVIGLDAQFFPAVSPKEDWRALVQTNREILAKADVVVLGTSTPFEPLIYYSPESLPRLAYWHPDNPRPPVSYAFLYSFEKNNISGLTTDDLLNAIKSGKRVCLVLGREPQIRFASSGILPKPDYLFVDEFLSDYDLHVMAWNYSKNPISAGL